MTAQQIPEDYKPIAKLHLPGSGRVITPFTHDQRASWLEDSPYISKSYSVCNKAIECLARAFNLRFISDCLEGSPLIRPERELFDEISISPEFLYGKFGPGGLHVIAIFRDDSEDKARVEYACFSNYEIEWADKEAHNGSL